MQTIKSELSAEMFALNCIYTSSEVTSILASSEVSGVIDLMCLSSPLAKLVSNLEWAEPATTNWAF